MQVGHGPLAKADIDGAEGFNRGLKYCPRLKIVRRCHNIDIVDTAQRRIVVDGMMG